MFRVPGAGRQVRLAPRRDAARGTFMFAALAVASAFCLAQEAPLPEVQRQSRAVGAAAVECNELVIPDVREPVTAPVLIVSEPMPQREPETRREALREEPIFEPVAIPAGEVALTPLESVAFLQEAARTGQYHEFDAALEVARRRVAALPASADRRAMVDALDVYADLEEIWKYAVTDPIGAFYNDATLGGAFGRLARKYPRYAEFIAPFEVTDSRGNRFYPTTETRAFLTAEAERRLRGVRLPPAPTGVIAERGTRPAPEVRREPVTRRPTPETRQPTAERREPTAERRPPTETRPPTAERREPTAERRPPTREPRIATATPSRRPRPRPRRPAPTRPEPVAPEEPVTAEPTEPPSGTAPPVSATGAPSVGTQIEPALEPPNIVTTPETAAPPPTTAPSVPTPQRRQPPAERRERISTNTLLLIAFALIALAAIALMIRAIRRREPAGPIIPREAHPPSEDAAASNVDWIDPETRHWIDDVNKPEKPPN